MLNIIKHHVSVALCYFKLSVQKQLEYPLYVLGTVIMIPMMYATGVLLLYLMVKNFQTLGGWTFPQLAFLFGLGNLSHGFMMVFSVQNWWIGTYVLRGEFDRMLLRPIGVFFQFSVMYFNVIGLMDVLVGGTIFLYACSLVQFEWSIVNTFKIILGVFGATLLRSAIYTIFCSTAFWTKRSQSIVTLLNDFMERTTMYPMSIYPNIIQIVLTFVLPIAFISYYPACDLLVKSSGINLPMELSLWTFGIGVAMIFLAKAVFRFGLRKYESSGS